MFSSPATFRSSPPTSSGSARTAYGQDTLAEGSMSDLSLEFAGKDRKASRPARTAYGQDAFTKGSMSDLSSKFAGKDRKNSRPTQTAPLQDIKVEDHCKSAGFVRASGQQRSKFVGVVTIFDLARCVQREGENPRDYLARWLRIRADLAHYPNDDAIYHFVEGLVLEICPRGNNKYSYYYIFVFMINVYIHTIMVLTRKR